MNPGVIYLLLAVSALAATLYYLFIVKGWDDWGSSARAGLAIIVLLVLPVLIMALWQQHGAKDRLAANGIALHPELGASIGVAVGSSMSNETWMFEFAGDSDSLFDFYRDADNRSRWALGYSDEMVLILERDTRRFSIMTGDDSAIFMLYESTDP